ncbi:MAG: linoleoyl-CoA desaturase [Crocinitomix sp.]
MCNRLRSTTNNLNSDVKSKFMEAIKFIAKDQNQTDFARELTKRVRLHFKEKKISTFGDSKMVVKAILMVGLYVSALVVIFTVPMSAWLALVLMIVMGIGEAGIGMGVMHDAAHGSFSKRKWLNTLATNSMFLLGSSVINWKIQHNVLHHTYPNVHEWDKDIDSKGLRLCTHSEQTQKVFRYQHLFGPLLYGLMTIVRFVSDFSHLKMYKDMGALEGQKVDYRKTVLAIALHKVIYLSVFFVLPFIFTPFLWWQVLIGFLVMHITASIIMGTVFQLAHLVENVREPLPNEAGEIHTQYAVHQLETTCDFGKRSGLFSWYVGGLNFQVEHHLFPHICHVHYPELAVIVEQTAKDYNQPYNSYNTTFAAFQSHLRTLKRLGRGELNEAIA